MCEICNLTKTFDPSRHPAGTDDVLTGGAGPMAPLPGTGTGSDAEAGGGAGEGAGAPPVQAGGSQATYVESADAAASIATIYAIQVGDSFSGTLAAAGDRDWVAVTLQAGESYQFDLIGTTLADPYLRIYDANGTLVGQNDDGGQGYNSSAFFTAATGGTYYLSAGAYRDYYAGGYTLSAAIATPSSTGTLSDLAAYLTDGYWGGGRRSFDTSASNQITVDLTALTGAGQQLARQALDLWEMVADLQFVEVTGGADITFDDSQSGAYASSSTSGGTILSSTINVSSQWLATYGTEIGSYSFQTYVHEIGHALGLGHQGGYNGSATYGVDETFANDSWQVSVMSYFNQAENSTVNASYAAVVSAMMADIVAIQDLYGAPGAGSATAGHTVWGGAGSNTGTPLDDVFDHYTDGSHPNVSGGPMTFTIYDRSGIDLLDLSWSDSGDRVNLNGATFSDVAGLIGNIGIAQGTMIENLDTGAGNDTVTGNAAANTITTGGGNDSVEGGTGNDTLYGNAGSDQLFGGDGNDRLLGGSNASLSVDALWGEAGDDMLFGEGGFDYLDGGTGNDYLDGGYQADNLYGRDGDDTLRGDQGLDRLFGGEGDDIGHGGSGNDGLFGERGNDTLNGGTGNDRFFGGLGNDLINGDSGDDTVFGGAGFDTIDGGTGNDVLQGDFNADTFVFADGHGQDTITDFDALNVYEVIDLSGVSTLNSLNDLLGPGGAASQVGADVVIDTGGGNSIRLTGVTLADLDGSDFAF